MFNTKVTPFYQQLAGRIAELGGMYNAHLHLDRAGTLDDKYMADSSHRIQQNSHISLHEKHALINTLHSGPAYDYDDLVSRANQCLDVMVATNTRRADTLVDCTADRVGISAIETLLELKRARANDIELNIGAYSPLGFRDDQPQRWEILEQGIAIADFIAALPEADDTDDYPGHIGFTEHCHRFLDIAQRKNCLVHVHTDQRNEPSERGTERLIDVLKDYGPLALADGQPMVWAVHMISPSTYDEARFNRLVEGLLDYNVGVICCPSAALGMRQLRAINTPTYNSIPRVLELLAAGVQVRLASDNIADICSPSTTADLTDEVFTLSAAIRFYNIDILAHLAAGVPLSDSQRAFIQDHLRNNNLEIDKVLCETGQADTENSALCL